MNIDDTLLERVDKAIRPELGYLNESHPKLIVTFSGPPSSGKSTIAKQLTEQLKAVRLENDAVRTLATKWFPNSSLEERSDLAHKYCNYSWPHLAREVPNGLWIIDSSLDRDYSIVFDFAKKFDFEVFVVALEIPVDLHRQWIIAGGDRPFSKMSVYLENMSRRRLEQEAFLAEHRPDARVHPPYDVSELENAISSRLQILVSKHGQRDASVHAVAPVKQ